MPKFRVTASELNWRTFEVEAADADEAREKVEEGTSSYLEPDDTLRAVDNGDGDFQITDVVEVE